MKAKAFPKTIFVRWEDDDEPFLIAGESVDGLGEDGDKIAVYTLSYVKTKVITETLQ